MTIAAYQKQESRLLLYSHSYVRFRHKNYLVS